MTKIIDYSSSQGNTERKLGLWALILGCIYPFMMLAVTNMVSVNIWLMSLPVWSQIILENLIPFAASTFGILSLVFNYQKQNSSLEDIILDLLLYRTQRPSIIGLEVGIMTIAVQIWIRFIFL